MSSNLPVSSHPPSPSSHRKPPGHSSVYQAPVIYLCEAEGLAHNLPVASRSDDGPRAGSPVLFIAISILRIRRNVWPR
jgi:hypothetical protein